MRQIFEIDRTEVTMQIDKIDVTSKILGFKYNFVTLCFLIDVSRCIIYFSV